MIETPEMSYSRGYFRVYTISEISSAGIPTVITTARAITENGFSTGQWYVEYFILIPNSECVFYKKQFTLNANQIIEDVKIDADFILNQAYKLACYELSNHLSNFHDERRKGGAALETYELVEASEDEIIGLWIRNQCKDNIKEIYENTKCSSLKKLLRYIINCLPSIKEFEKQNL